MYKRSCVIALSDINGKKFMFKNRDRNYTPQLKIYHTMRNGVEMVYFRDEHTGWVEGINEYGIGISNSALMVIWDEKEGKGGKKKKDNITLGALGSRDASRILKTLECRTFEDALETVIHYDGGVRGHTFLSDGVEAKSVEHTARHKAFISDLSAGKHHVRSNHGDNYPDAGYTIGENKESSHTRLKKVFDTLSEVESPEDLIRQLYAQRFEDPTSPFNVVRRTDNMYTSSQLIYDFEEKKISLYLVPEDCDYLGYVKDFSHQGVCSFDVYRLGYFNSDGSFRIKKIKANPVRVANRVKMASRQKADKKAIAPIIKKKILNIFDKEERSSAMYKHFEEQFGVGNKDPLINRDESLFIEWVQNLEEDIPPKFWRSLYLIPEDGLSWEAEDVSLVGDLEWAVVKGGTYICGKALVSGLWEMSGVGREAYVAYSGEFPIYSHQEWYLRGLDPEIDKLWEKFKNFLKLKTAPNGESKGGGKISRGWEGKYHFSKVVSFCFPVFEDKLLDIQYKFHIGILP